MQSSLDVVNDKLVVADKKTDVMQAKLVQIDLKINMQNVLFLQMLSHFTISSNIVKDRLIKICGRDIIKFDNRSPGKGIHVLKLICILTFFNKEKTQMFIRFACCNFNNVITTTREIANEYTNKAKPNDLLFYSVTAIALSNDTEVNAELKMFSSVFKNAFAAPDYGNKWKMLSIDNLNHLQTINNIIVSNLKNKFTMHHKDNLLNYKNNNSLSNEMKTKANKIYEYACNYSITTTKYCQMYLDSYIKTDENYNTAISNYNKMKALYSHNLAIKQDDTYLMMRKPDYAKVLIKIYLNQFNINNYIRYLTN